MSKSDSVWYRLGYAVERARHAPTSSRLATLAERRETQRPTTNGDHGALRAVQRWLRPHDPAARSGGDRQSPSLTPLLEGLGVAAVGKLFARGRPSVPLIAAGAAIGAAAEVVRQITRQLRGELRERELSEDLIRGAANGMIYATFLGPIAPGAVLGKGLTYGAASFLASAQGGVPHLLGSLSPHHRVPGAASLVKAEPDTDDLVDHLVFGLAMAALYESSRVNRGTRASS